MPAHRQRVIFARAAERDLDGIFTYIAAENPRAAERQVRLIVDACESLSDLAERGHPRPDLAPGLRQLLVLPYIAFYFVRRDRIEIARVLHGRRNTVGEFENSSKG